jgi:hypothetical protein
VSWRMGREDEAGESAESERARCIETRLGLVGYSLCRALVFLLIDFLSFGSFLVFALSRGGLSLSVWHFCFCV